ncbi:MAG: CPBP family intramembrane metalloprotease [Candidatus Zixiibacteriota bacterium]|nr:MAG: CPBP family intramembrane metalloprotease [candidate division Zixibacteria bacterium]
MAVFDNTSLLDPNNYLFREARSAVRLPGILLSTFVHILLIAFGVGTVVLLLLWAYGNMEEVERILNGDLGHFVPFSLMVVGLWAWVTFYEKRSLRTIGLTGSRILLKYLLGFITGLVMLAATVGLMALSRNVAPETGDTQVGGAIALGGILIMLARYIIQGGTEEIITRGWYLGVLGARYRPWIGIVVSSVLFSVLHATTNPVALLNLFLFGFFLALYCLHEGSVWGVCGWHSAWNLAQAKIFGLSVSGHAASGWTLLDLQPMGSTVLSGGRYGPEGSIYATIIFVIGIMVVLLLSKASKPSQ